MTVSRERRESFPDEMPVRIVTATIHARGFRAGRSCARAFSRLVKTVISDVLPRRKRKAYVRAVKRRPKPYPLLMKPRDEYAPEEVK